MLTTEQYNTAKAKLQALVAQRIENDDTERLRAVVNEYEDLQASIPAPSAELKAKHAKKAEKVAAGFAKAAKKSKKTK